MMKNPTSLWSRILHAKYGSPIGKESVQNMSTCSVIWRGVWTSFQLLVAGLRLGTDGKIDREIWWERSAKGIFTTKSAYEIISSETCKRDSQQKWKGIWNFSGQTRGSLLLWMVAHDRLKTNGLLWDRTNRESPRCELCGHAYESTLHAVRDCKLPRQIWSELLNVDRQRRFWTESEPQQWINVNIQRSGLLCRNCRLWKYIVKERLTKLWA